MRSPVLSVMLVLGAGVWVTLSSVGCQTTETPDTWPGAPSGSLSDLNRKMGQPAKPSESAPAQRARPQLLLVVMHDAEGRPVYVETQQSSGDSALDQRAQDWVLKERRFPKGAPNTVVISVDPKRVPKR